MASFLSALLRAPGQPFMLRDIDASSVVATTIESAFDSASRRRGLLGRSHLPDGSALVIAPCSAVHTCFMRMAIDVVFVSRQGRILKVYEALAAWRIGFAVGAFAAIELPAGTTVRVHATRGHHLALTPADH